MVYSIKNCDNPILLTSLSHVTRSCNALSASM